MKQLQLPFTLDVKMRFGNWLETESNQALLKALMSAFDDEDAWVAYLYSAQSLGKTHLLQACAHEALTRGKNALYLDFNTDLPSNILADITTLDCLCLDNIDNLAPDNQYALFELYNQMKHQPFKLMVSAHSRPQQLDFAFNDIKTRLSRALVMQLVPYADEDIKQILKMRSKNKSLTIETAVYDYLLTHYTRDIGALSQLLEKLETEAIAQQKKPSLSLIKMLIKGE